jgi:hypothetical protein
MRASSGIPGIFWEMPERLSPLFHAVTAYCLNLSFEGGPFSSMVPSRENADIDPETWNGQSGQGALRRSLLRTLSREKNP